jgi:hypothetical protein
VLDAVARAPALAAATFVPVVGAVGVVVDVDVAA